MYHLASAPGSKRCGRLADHDRLLGMIMVLPSGIRRPHPLTVTGDLPMLLAVTFMYQSPASLPKIGSACVAVTLTRRPLCLQVMTCQASEPTPVTAPTIPSTSAVTSMPDHLPRSERSLPSACA